MRDMSLIPATILSIMVALGAWYPVDPASAQAGCCLRRAALGSPWVATNLSFETCLDENETNDSDDIFAEAGLVWWSITC